MTDIEAGPTDLLKVIRCGCKGMCDNCKCTCRKAGLKCTYLCNDCHGTSCTNTDAKTNDTDEDLYLNYNDDEDRNFIWIFSIFDCLQYTKVDYSFRKVSQRYLLKLILLDDLFCS